MKKIDNYENIKESTGFERLPIGGYVCAIKHVDDVPEKQYLKVYFDIIKGEHKGYFQKQYDEDTRPDKKWPNAGTLCRSYKETALPMFKGFTNAVQDSNKGYVWNFDESTLAKKYIGLVIGEEEYLSQKGQLRVRNHVVGVHKVETIEKGDFKMPELKKLDASKTVATTATAQPFVDPFADSAPTTAQPVTAAPNENPWGDDSDDPFS